MNENEKLRALLAEAREALVCAENRMMAPPHQVREAISSIDAALAEPVVDYQRERDEARAEVERLKGAYQRGAEDMREAAAQSVFTAASLHPEPCRRSELRQALVDAIEALPIPEDK